MVGIVRVAQDGTIVVGGDKSRFRLEKSMCAKVPWQLVEVVADGTTILRHFGSEFEALAHVVNSD